MSVFASRYLFSRPYKNSGTLSWVDDEKPLLDTFAKSSASSSKGPTCSEAWPRHVVFLHTYNSKIARGVRCTGALCGSVGLLAGCVGAGFAVNAQEDYTYTHKDKFYPYQMIPELVLIPMVAMAIPAAVGAALAWGFLRLAEDRKLRRALADANALNLDGRATNLSQAVIEAIDSADVPRLEHLASLGGGDWAHVSAAQLLHLVQRHHCAAVAAACRLLGARAAAVATEVPPTARVSPFHAAAMAGDLPTFRALCEAGADLQASEKDDGIPVSALACKHPALATYLKNRRVQAEEAMAQRV